MSLSGDGQREHHKRLALVVAGHKAVATAALIRFQCPQRTSDDGQTEKQ
jgi:hypothetical protein